MHLVVRAGLLVTILVALVPGAAAAGVAVWDPRFGGATVGEPGFAQSVYAITNDGPTVYAAGGFWGVWVWNGSAWTRIGPSLAFNIHALAVTSNHDIYAGGTFSSLNLNASGPTANNIAHWNGNTWDVLNVGGTVLSTGCLGTVHALATAPNGSDVYVGGNFTVAGGLGRNYVALWDGTTFQPVGNNSFNGTVYDILVSGSDTYFGGDFTIPFTRVAKYNGSTLEFINGGPWPGSRPASRWRPTRARSWSWSTPRTEGPCRS
jgi:hypothetical protein